MKTGEYYYTLSGREYRIYRYDMVDETGSIASPVPNEPHYYNEEDARRRVYELNGWTYKPRPRK